MKKSCQCCGRMHDAGEICPAHKRVCMPKGKRKGDEFFSTEKWQHKRLEISEREHYFGEHVITNEEIEVHHIGLRLEQLRALADVQEKSQQGDRIKNLRELLLDVIFATAFLRRYVLK